MIEKVGINKSITLSATLSALGLWLGFVKYFGFGVILISIGLPFALNATTKLACAWFGPRGRSFAIALSILFYQGGATLYPFIPTQKYSDKGPTTVLSYAIIMTLLVPLCFLFVSDRPDFAPTMSEEGKTDLGPHSIRKDYRLVT
jgi:hypothetical protein